MSTLNYLLLLIICIAMRPVDAVFIQAQHYFDGDQHVYFFHDVHQANEQASKQQADLMSFAKRLNATLLTEEMTSVDTLQRYIHDKQLIAQIESDCKERLSRSDVKNFPLMGLSGSARAQGVNSWNVDYRLWADPCDTGKALTACMVVNILNAVIDEVKQYDDSVIFNAYYAHAAEMVQRDFKRMWDYLTAHDQAMRELVFQDEFITIARSLYNPVVNEYSEHWVLYDSSIFNCLLLHTIANCDSDHIIVCAGAFHCEVVGDLLEKSGFKPLSVPTQETNVVDVQKLERYIGQDNIDMQVGSAVQNIITVEQSAGFSVQAMRIILSVLTYAYQFMIPDFVPIIM